MKSGLLSTAVAACGLLLAAQCRHRASKIGILNDHPAVLRGITAQVVGRGGQDGGRGFGGSVLDQKIEIVSADIRTNPISASVSRGAGMRSKAST